MQNKSSSCSAIFYHLCEALNLIWSTYSPLICSFPPSQQTPTQALEIALPGPLELDDRDAERRPSGTVPCPLFASDKRDCCFARPAAVSRRRAVCEQIGQCPPLFVGPLSPASHPRRWGADRRGAGGSIDRALCN